MEWRRGSQALRIEDRLEADRYVLRAELPGIDPDKDVEIKVADGVLSISAERRAELSEKGRSEFHYGSFMRRVTLPQGAQEDRGTQHPGHPGTLGLIRTASTHHPDTPRRPAGCRAPRSAGPHRG